MNRPQSSSSTTSGSARWRKAQEVTTDIPEDSVTYDQQAVGPKKVRPGQIERLPAEIRVAADLTQSEGEIAALTTWMRQIGVDTPGALRPWSSSASSFSMNG